MRADTYAARSQKSRLCQRLFPLLFRLCLLAASMAAAANPEFHAPYSGERVEEYDVTLSVSPQERRAFHIPNDCPAAHYAFTQGAPQWCNRVERRIWDKVMQDCYYVAFLQQSGRKPEHDFVSGYDFMNADLHDLVVDNRCGSATGIPCEPVPPGVIDLRQVLARVSIAPHGEGEATSEQCRVKKGLFRGWVEFRKEGLVCRADPHANGFRMVAVDFADVNSDGYMDAVIRVIPMGRGQRHVPLILPLTRFSKDGPFMIPPHLPRL